MSKKQKFKSKSIVPPNMKGTIFTSLSDLGSALGFKPSEQPTARSMKCRKCGKPMRQIPGTNVWLCDSMVENEKKELVPCGNRAMTSVRPVPQNSEPKGNKPKPKVQDKSTKAKAATA